MGQRGRFTQPEGRGPARLSGQAAEGRLSEQSSGAGGCKCKKLPIKMPFHELTHRKSPHCPVTPRKQFLPFIHGLFILSSETEGGEGGVISGIKPQVSSVRKQGKHVKNSAPRPPHPQRLVLTPSSVYLVELGTKLLLVALQYIRLSLGKCLLAFTHTRGLCFWAQWESSVQRH